ncbi:MAG: hypothetical protein QXE38_05155 [Candidatus Methanomethylicia archaeon]
MFSIKSKFGATPVISTVILVGAVIVAFSFVLVFKNQWIKVSRYYDVEGVYERIVIEDVWFMPLQNNRVIRLTITNVGKIDVKIVMILIFKKDGNILVKSYNSELDLYVIHEAVSIDLVLDTSWTPKTVYRIEIITLRGNKFEVVCTSP